MANPVTQNLGPVTAYGIARANGYQGSEQQWAQDQANAGANAAAAREYASSASSSAEKAAGSAETATAQAQTAGKEADRAKVEADRAAQAAAKWDSLVDRSEVGA